MTTKGDPPPTPAAEPKEADEDLQLTAVFGEFGRYQLTLGSLCLLSCILGAWNALGYTFLSFPMDHWCARPQEHQYMNLSHSEWQNLSIPMVRVKGKEERSKCLMHSPVPYREPALNRGPSPPALQGPETSECQFGWEFDRSFFHESIVSRWGLTCDKSWLVSMSQSVYMSGFLVAVLVFGQLGDRVGRRPIMLFCVALYLCAGFAVAFANSFPFFVVSRFLVAMGIHGLYTTGFVALMESAGPVQRPRLSIMLGAGWATGFITLPGLGYLTKDWATMQLVIACVSILLVLFYWWMPESPRWLLTQGKTVEAEKIMIRAAKMNGCWNDQAQNLMKRVFLKAEEERRVSGIVRATALDLLRTPNMRKKTLLMFYAWFVTSFVYYGLSLNTGDLGGDPFMNFAIAGAIEFPCLVVGYLVIRYLGRRKPLSFVLLLAAASCLGTIPVGEDLLWLRISLAMLGKCGVSIAFGLVYIYSAELNPTVVRNVGVGSSSTCARVGSVLAPFVKELGKVTNRGVPMGVFGGLTALSGLLILLLPETMNQPIQDSLEQGEQFGKKTKETKAEASQL